MAARRKSGPAFDARPPSVTVVPIGELIADPDNARVRDATARGALKASLSTFGAARSAVIDADGVVRAGNGTVEAAKAAGVKEAIIVEADGDRLVVVRRRDLSGTRALAYGVADNHVATLARWDEQRLASHLTAIAGDAALLPLLEPMSLAGILGPDKMRDLAFLGGTPPPADTDGAQPDQGPETVSMTFVVTAEQQELVLRALAIAKRADDGGQGARIAEVCEAYIATMMVHDEGDEDAA